MTADVAWRLRYDTRLASARSNEEAEELLAEKVVGVQHDWTAYHRALATRIQEQSQSGLGEPMWMHTWLSVRAGAGGAGLLGLPLVQVHESWGTPLISGDTLKGACRAEARVRLDVPDTHEDIRTMFGSTASLASLAFDDAWWVPPGFLRGWQHPQPGPYVLERDNPNEDSYHATRGEGMPGLAGDRLTPVAPLAAMGTFAFWVGAAPRQTTDAATWRAAARRLLQLTLASRGVGAGVATDRYGRFFEV